MGKSSNLNSHPHYKQPSGIEGTEDYNPKANQARHIKSAPRGNSESTKAKNKNKIMNSSLNNDNQKRSSSYKERKQKPSPLRTQKIPPKNNIGISNYMPMKSKSNTNNHVKKFKALNTTSVRTNPNQPQTGINSGYKEPITQNVNLIKAHNLSLNNFKTEIKLPNAQKFLNETQFVKSPFLSKTFKGMMQNGKHSKVNTNVLGSVHASNYGRIGNTFQMTTTTGKRRGPSGHSNKSKRDNNMSNSHKKSNKQQKMFNSKKLSFNNSNGKQVMTNMDHMNMLSRKLNTNKMYSRNDGNLTLGPG